MDQTQLLADIMRGELSESRHRGFIAVADSRGNLRYATGEGDGPVAFFRSSAKPFQAIPLIESGAADFFGLSDKELAVACASHNGEEDHVRTVAEMLNRAGLSPEQLLCGAHLPYSEPDAAALVKAGQPPSNLHSNCSGKHAGMLLVCKKMGWPLENYNEPQHPLQKWILELVAEFCGLPASEVATGVDGCSVVCFGVSVRQMATGFARLADPGYWEEAGKPEHAVATRRIIKVMMAHPFMIAGTGRADTDLMEAAPGRIFSKGGAEAVWCMGFPEQKVGLALKVEDGSNRAHGLIVAEALRQIGFLSEPEIAIFAAQQIKPFRNVRGQVVGEFRPAFKLTRASY